jgi:hypothetical protein
LLALWILSVGIYSNKGWKGKMGKKEDKLSFLFNLKEVKTRRRNFKEVIKKDKNFKKYTKKKRQNRSCCSRIQELWARLPSRTQYPRVWLPNRIQELLNPSKARPIANRSRCQQDPKLMGPVWEQHLKLMGRVGQ